MSQINQKKPQIPPNFEPLNNRKTVGQTYGERREKMASRPENVGQDWLKRTKDFFLGGPKVKNIDDFSNQTDRYEEVKKARMTQLQDGTSIHAKVKQPSGEKYITFLDSILHYLSPLKK